MSDDSDVVLVETKETSVVVTPGDSIVSIVVEEKQVITDEMQSVALLESSVGYVVAEGQQGPPGVDGSGAGGEVFVLDVTPTSTGLVGGKSYINGTPELDACLSDTTHVRIHVGCEGGNDSYKPEVTVNLVPVTLVESSTVRWFTGYADITLPSGINTVNVVSNAGGTDTVIVEVLGAGPSVLSISFGAYPGIQTELKAGDAISVTVTTDIEATSVTVLAQGAVSGTTIPVIAGTGVGTLTISSASGSQVVTAKAKNSFGTFGTEFVSSALTLNQTYPTIGAVSVTYPASQGALNTGDHATVSSTITNFSTVAYSGAHFTIDQPSVYAIGKDVTPTFTGYEGSGSNYTITANRAQNNATSTLNALVKIATVPPTAVITLVPSGRLVSSPTGISYDVRITPDQTLSTAPTLTASHGTWAGSWALVGSYWHRSLVVSDAVSRGVGSFTSLVLTGLSGLVGNTISSGSSYVVGGFSSRTLTFPAFSRVTPIGVAVADATKLTASLAGGASLTRYTDNSVHSNGFYPANADGSYNATGEYIGLSDSAFAGANTSGTLQLIAQESA